MEIERKYTIRHLPEQLEQYPVRHIEQAYLCTDPVIRIRRSNDRYILTYKSIRSASQAAKARKENGAGKPAPRVNDEVELELTREGYEHLLEKADGYRITKDRSVIPLAGGLVAELDIFHGRLEGLVFVEVEFPSVAASETFQAPEWFDRDVSGDRHYVNSYLSTVEQWHQE